MPRSSCSNISTYQEYAQCLLAYGGWPQTPSNVRFVTAWAQSENGAPELNGGISGSQPYNMLGMTSNGSLVAYDSWPASLQATAGNIHGGYYPNLNTALSNGNASESFSQGALTSDLLIWDPDGADIKNIASYLSGQSTTPGNSGTSPKRGQTTTSPSLAPAPGSQNNAPTTGGPADLMANCEAYRNRSGATTNCLMRVVTACTLNACQAKALISGALVLGGGIVMLVGIALLASGTKAGKMLAGATVIGKGMQLVGGGRSSKVTENQAQKREVAAYNQGHREGRTMSTLGSSVPRGSGTSFTPHPDDALFAEE
jgi:hypothetical protein